MTSLDALFDQYKTAHSDGDTRECDRILDIVPGEDLDAFTARLEAAGLDRDAAPGPDAEKLRETLVQSGMGANEAQSLSVLSTGSFVEFVRDRMRARELGADTILREAFEDAEAQLDDGDEALVHAWLEAVKGGEDEPDIELPHGAEVLLARALGSTEQTILAVRERG